MALNNPAGRLQAIITRGKKQKRDSPAEKVWAELLGVSPENKSLLLRRVGHVMALPSAIRESVSSISDIDHNVYLQWLHQVEASLSILNFQMQWAQFIDRFDGAVMYGLGVCSDLLSRQRPEKSINEQALSELLSEVADLISEVSTQKFPPDLREHLLTHLISVQSALEEYQLRGVAPLEKEFQAILGSSALYPDLYKRTQQTEPGRKFWKFMRNLALAITVAVGTIQIGKDVVSLLPSPEENIIDDQKSDGESSESKEGPTMV